MQLLDRADVSTTANINSRARAATAAGVEKQSAIAAVKVALDQAPRFR
jgi:hypothetical protein